MQTPFGLLGGRVMGGTGEYDYVSADTTKLIEDVDKDTIHLLWGDRVEVLDRGGDHWRVKARGKTGMVPAKDLGGKSLLEVYFIDVAIGDGLLIRTPDGRHIMIDGGKTRSQTQTGKNAADFVDWKFHQEYEQDTVVLDAMVSTHCDDDHYGGLWDMASDVPDQRARLDTAGARVGRFFHAGVGRWTNAAGKEWLGATAKDGHQTCLVQLMGDRDAVERSLDGGSAPQLSGSWAKFMRAVTGLKTAAGEPTPIERLSSMTGYLPGYEPEKSEVAIKVLGPTEVSVDGKPALRSLGDAGKTRNGNSVILRLDYGKMRVLLAGDSNRESQVHLLRDCVDPCSDFAADVMKAVHHGSDDFSYEFLSAVKAAVTVISSGDTDSFDHPRPAAVAASALTGHFEYDQAAHKLISPLVYSTELARSYALGQPQSILRREATATAEQPAQIVADAGALDAYSLDCKETVGLRTRKITKELGDPNTRVVTGLVYGLVNVRTDGERILVATMNEADGSWNARLLQSRNPALDKADETQKQLLAAVHS